MGVCIIKMKCKNCGQERDGHIYYIKDEVYCKQFIPNHSPNVSTKTDKDPVITGKSVDSETAGSAFILSDKKFDDTARGFGYYEKDVAEAVRRLKSLIHARERKLITQDGLINGVNKIFGEFK